MLGTTLSGRYKIVKHLGGGGFGQTYLAQDLQLPGHPICVVKQLKPKSTDPTTFEIARRLFDREAQVLYKLGNYDQIPRLLAHFEEQQEFYLVQEFIEGDELKREMPFGNPLSEIQVITICGDILKILEFVHQQDVIHRDIKPSNIIRRKQDSKLVLIDFGAVKQVSTQTVSLQQPPKDTVLTVSIGSPGYMPNEQLAGKPQFSSDIYAVGMLALQALSGLPPHQLPADPKTSEILWREKLLQSTLHEQVNISPELADVLDTMVRYDYRQRYESATEALQALEQLTIPSPYQSNAPTSQVTQTASASTPPPTATYSVSPQVPPSQLDSTFVPTQAPPTATLLQVVERMG
jgi:serine/threonine protein kinase